MEVSTEKHPNSTREPKKSHDSPTEMLGSLSLSSVENADLNEHYGEWNR
jgi:hypothetical protein